MNKKALDEKYSYQIDENNVVHLFRGEEDCQQLLTNPLLSAIFKIESFEKENAELKELFADCDTCKRTCDVGNCCKFGSAYLPDTEKILSKQKELTKAKEIIKEFVQVEYADFTNGDYSNELSKVLEQAEQFLKGSEVEK